MPDTAVALPDNGKPERQSHLPGDKVRAALDLMLWQGCHRDEAAKLAGIKPKSLYWALRKPHVKQYYLAGLRVLRESTRAKTFHRLEALRDQDENKAAAVKACQVLEHIADLPATALVGGVPLRHSRLFALAFCACDRSYPQTNPQAGTHRERGSRSSFTGCEDRRTKCGRQHGPAPADAQSQRA